MYGYKWLDGENGIFQLDVSIPVQKEIRPVFKEELDFFEMYKYWDYPDTTAPLLWAEGIRKYILNGEVIAEAKGGSFYNKPIIEIKNKTLKKLKPIDLHKLLSVNTSVMQGLIQRSIEFISNTYEKYVNQGYNFVAAYSGGKDSIVILDLVQRALAPDSFIAVFGDTGMELKTTYDAVTKAKAHYTNLNFQVAKSEYSAEETWAEFGPPGRRLRWCCAVHKSIPTLMLLKKLSSCPQVKAVVFDGVRAEESEQRSTYDELSEGKKHINQINCSPIFKWNTAEVWLYILGRNILFNDAYRIGLFRVGCAVCPLSSSWWDGIANIAYKDDLAPFLKIVEDYATATKPASEVRKYIIGGGWKARFGGRGLKNGGNRVYEIIENDTIKFYLTENRQNWIDVARILGPIVEREDNTCSQVIDGVVHDFVVSGNGLSITYSNFSKMNKFAVSHLRGIANKVAYCIGCNACAVECPTGAFEIDENKHIMIHADKCIHCCKCITEIAKGCKVARSLSTTQGGNTMDLRGINRYQHFGFRDSWLEHFFDLGNDCWSSKELGNRQYDALKVYLKEGELIEVASSTNRNGQITPLGHSLQSLGSYNPLTWAIIWVNLTYNSTLFKWYALTIPKDDINSKAELIYLMGDFYSESTRSNAATSLVDTLNNSPIGNVLGLGISVPTNGGVKYLKKGWSSPDAIAILYAMFRYAEKLDGHYNMTLKELRQIRTNRPENFIGMDPVTIFALDDDEFKGMLRQLANEYPDYIKIAFVADLDNITLNKEKTSLDVVNLALGGN